MEKVKELTRFYEAIRKDAAIGPSHISVYMALFQLYNLNGFTNPVNICRKGVMEVAKIAGTATFHKCIKDLQALGYIQYCPSYKSEIHSQVRLLKV